VGKNSGPIQHDFSLKNSIPGQLNFDSILAHVEKKKREKTNIKFITLVVTVLMYQVWASETD